MKWRYLLVNLPYGEVYGCNSISEAHDISYNDDWVVLDVGNELPFLENGKNNVIEEINLEPRE